MASPFKRIDLCADCKHCRYAHTGNLDNGFNPGIGDGYYDPTCDQCPDKATGHQCQGWLEPGSVVIDRDAQRDAGIAALLEMYRRNFGPRALGDFEQGYADPNSVQCPECHHVGKLATDHPRYVESLADTEAKHTLQLSLEPLDI